MFIPSKPIINRRHNGEFSTVEVAPGRIETMWFGIDGSQVHVGTTYVNASREAEKHIAAFESKA